MQTGNELFYRKARNEIYRFYGIDIKKTNMISNENFINVIYDKGSIKTGNLFITVRKDKGTGAKKSRDYYERVFNYCHR